MRTARRCGVGHGDNTGYRRRRRRRRGRQRRPSLWRSDVAGRLGPRGRRDQAAQDKLLPEHRCENWDALRELLDPLIVVDTTCSAGPILTGRDPFIALLQLTLGGANTHHQGSDPQIHLTSATTAEGVWTLEDVLIFGGTLGVHGYGHYQDRYVKTGGKWMEKYSKLTRTRIDLINPDGTVIQADAPLDQVAAKVKAVTGQ